MNLIFILSLPRSGSTLLQRIIATHPRVSTVTEPWLQLPLVNIFRDQQIFTDYGHSSSKKALNDIIQKLPNGIEDLYSALRKASSEIYKKMAEEGDEYFIDKTPRYHLICNLLAEIFPEAKFIILWRNPLAIASSIIQTWGNGNWMLYKYKVDLFKGFRNLYNFKLTHTNVIESNYETLVGENSIQEWRQIFNYLELEFEPEYLRKFSNVKLKGKMGDPSRDDYSHIKNNTNKWKATYNNILRTQWARNYLDWIGEERLEQINYDYYYLKSSLPKRYLSKSLGGDFLGMSKGIFLPWVEPYIFNTKIKANSKADILNHF